MICVCLQLVPVTKMCGTVIACRESRGTAVIRYEEGRVVLRIDAISGNQFTFVLNSYIIQESREASWFIFVLFTFLGGVGI